MAPCLTLPIRKPTRRPDAALQQPIWAWSLSTGALCVGGRVWQPCGGGAGDRPLRCLGSAWGAPLAFAGGPQHAGAGGCRHHLRRLAGARARAKGACAGGLGSWGVGASAPPTPPGRWLGAGLGASHASRAGAVSAAAWLVGASPLLPRDR